MKWKQWPIDMLSLVIIPVILFWSATHIKFGGENWKGIIENDAKGYYAYLPAIFIYNDLQFEFVPAIERNNHPDRNGYFYDYRAVINGKVTDKYYCGTALCEAPFFLAAHMLARPLGYEPNGYTKPYFEAISIASIFYFLLGLIFIRKLLKLYGLSAVNIAIVLWVCAFGTHAFSYCVWEPGMSHVFSFAFVAMFIYYFKCWVLNYGYRNMLLACIALGMVVLIRPINALIVAFVPFLIGSSYKFTDVFKKYITSPKLIATTVLIPVLFFFIQLVIYKIQTGNFFVYAYTQEGFNFSKPEIINFLFSYKKGLFIYTPVAFVSLFGLIVLFKESLYKGLSFLLFFLLVVYVLSSWWMWWYGGSFSARPMVEYLPCLMIAMGLLLNSLKRVPKYLFVGLLFFFVYVNQVQVYQYRYTIIHWDSMTKEMYWNVFLKRHV